MCPLGFMFKAYKTSKFKFAMNLVFLSICFLLKRFKPLMKLIFYSRQSFFVLHFCELKRLLLLLGLNVF